MTKGVKKKPGSSASLGQALIRKHPSASKAGRGGAGRGPPKVGAIGVPLVGQGTVQGKHLASVVEQSDLQDFLESAELAGREFAAQRGQAEVIFTTPEDGRLLHSLRGHPADAEFERKRRAEEKAQRQHLAIPRRPHWRSGMGVEQLDAQERAAFLEWRRSLARLEENELLRLTPFEKNLDIWRQLWRVLERSNVVVTVVDSRDPLFYRCPDLENYVREIDPGKKTMLLLNKADLLPLDVRQKWADYFDANGIDFAFWSAAEAFEEVSEEVKREGAGVAGSEGDLVQSRTHIFSRAELLSVIEAKAREVKRRREGRQGEECAGSHEATGAGGLGREHSGQQVGEAETVLEAPQEQRPVMVGFVGYPNVGKSSTINALLGAKKTGVTSTPGKTKHFQTLPVSPTLTLCDCPGLVFPSFASSRSEMVAAGVLPIDRIQDHRGPVAVVCRRVARGALEEVYGISLPKPAPHEDPRRGVTAAELLKTIGVARGHLVHSGLPDETRVARLVLKDFLGGKLTHYRLPPTEAARETEGEDEWVEREKVEGERETEGEELDGEGEEDEDWDEVGEEWVEVEDGEEGESDGGSDGENDGAKDGDHEEAHKDEGSKATRASEVRDRSTVGLTEEGALKEGSNVPSASSRVELELEMKEKGSKGGEGPKSPNRSRKGEEEGDLEVGVDSLELDELGGLVSGPRTEAKAPMGRRKAAHKMHKKEARRKDRSWRVSGDAEGPYANAAFTTRVAVSLKGRP